MHVRYAVHRLHRKTSDDRGRHPEHPLEHPGPAFHHCQVKVAQEEAMVQLAVAVICTLLPDQAEATELGGRGLPALVVVEATIVYEKKKQYSSPKKRASCSARSGGRAFPWRQPKLLRLGGRCTFSIWLVLFLVQCFLRFSFLSTPGPPFFTLLYAILFFFLLTQ